MKVLIITPCGLPVPAVKGGAVLTLVDSLIKQNEIQNQLELSVISSYDIEAEKRSNKITKTKFIFIKHKKIVSIIDNIIDKIYKCLSNKHNNYKKEYFWKYFLIKKIQKIILKNEYDKLIFENSGFLLKILRNKKISLKYSNNIYFHIHNDIPDNIDLNCLKKCHIISVSNYLKQKLDLFVPCTSQKEFFLLKNGFDVKQFNCKLNKSEIITLKKELGFDNDDKIIIFAGRIVPEKGILELTNAFKKISNNHIKLLVIGSHKFGDNQKSLFLSKMNKTFEQLKGRVVFTGYVDYKKIWKYYKIADIAVLPSIWQEPAGLTMLEACASEIPLITTANGGIPEYLNNKIVTFINSDELIEENIYKAIMKIFKHYNKYKQKAHLASKYVFENYSEETFYNNFCMIMKSRR